MNQRSADSPSIYLDTTVLLDIVDRRDEGALETLDIIKDRSLSVLASPFGILEKIEAKKTDRWAESMLDRGYTVVQISRRMGSRRSGPTALTRDELAEVHTSIREALQNDLKIVGFPEPTPGLMNQAEEICSATTLAAADSLHLATALYFGCRLLVTSDSDLIRTARNYISATSPQGFRNAFTRLLAS